MKGLWDYVCESHLEEYYHFTSIGSLLSMLKFNKFNLSDFEGSRNKGYKYFMSLTRAKYSKQGYARSMFNCNARIVLDDDKLSRDFKIVPIDFYPGAKNLAIKGQDDGWEVNNRDGQQYVEADERLLSNKENIFNISKYIKQIDLNGGTLDDDDKSVLDKFFKSYNIYWYDTDKDFALQKNGKILL